MDIPKTHEITGYEWLRQAAPFATGTMSDQHNPVISSNLGLEERVQNVEGKLDQLLKKGQECNEILQKILAAVIVIHEMASQTDTSKESVTASYTQAPAACSNPVPSEAAQAVPAAAASSSENKESMTRRTLRSVYGGLSFEETDALNKDYEDRSKAHARKLAEQQVIKDAAAPVLQHPTLVTPTEEQSTDGKTD